MYTITAFGAIPLPQSRPSHFVGTGSASNFTILPLSAGGVYDSLGSNRAFTQGTQIRVVGAILLRDQTAVQLETQEKTLRGMVGKVDQLWRTWDESGALEWCTARCISVGETRTVENLNYLDIPMTFQVTSLGWFGQVQKGFIDADPLDKFSLLRTLAHNPANTWPVYYTLNYAGTENQPAIILTLTSGDNSTTAVGITSITMGHVLAWTGVLATTKKLIINCGMQRVTNDGAPAYSALTVPTNKDEWFMLQPGINEIALNVTTSGSEPTFEIAYYDLSM